VTGADDLDGVRALIRRHTPLAAETLEPLGAGTDSTAYRVDGAWVARIPATAAARASLAGEHRLLPLLADELSVPVGVFEHVARDRDGAVALAVHRMLDGAETTVAALAALPGEARDRALDDLAAVLAALRRVPPGAAGVRLRPHHGFGHPSQRELHRRLRGRIGAADAARVEALWRASEAGPRQAPLLAHADLKPEHVLHDPRTGRLTGVLDWGDACLSHPHYDLAVIGLFFDAATRDDVAARLPAAAPCRVAGHAGLLVAVRWLGDLDLAVGAGDEPIAAMCAARLRAHLDALQ
jgi:aminoglycoside phosphotransferase (APT) family kinase protein